MEKKFDRELLEGLFDNGLENSTNKKGFIEKYGSTFSDFCERLGLKKISEKNRKHEPNEGNGSKTALKEEIGSGIEKYWQQQKENNSEADDGFK